MAKEVNSWAEWEAALDCGESVEDLLGLGAGDSPNQNAHTSQPQTSSQRCGTVEDPHTAFTIPGVPGRTVSFVLPIKPFHVGRQNMEAETPVSSLSNRLLVTSPFIPLNNLLGPCLYIPPRDSIK